MKITTKLFILLLLANLTTVFAQKTTTKNLSLDKGTIKEQFEFIKKKSSNYQSYKVVKRVWLNQLENHIFDSINELKKDLVNTDNQIKIHQKTITDLKKELESINAALSKTKDSKDNIDFLGLSFKKKDYKIIVWSILAIMAFALAYFIYSFKNSNHITKNTLTNYSELEEEYSSYRTRALEREQLLNRKLQDEINKQKKS